MSAPVLWGVGTFATSDGAVAFPVSAADHAADTAGLLAVYTTLDTKLVTSPEAIELTGLVAGASVLLLVIGGLLSLRWLGRLP